MHFTKDLTLWFCSIVLMLSYLDAQSQEPVYHIKFSKEATISGSILAFGISDLITSKSLLPVNNQTILGLEYDDLPTIDQGAINNWSPALSNASDKLEIAGFIYPFSLLALKPVREHAGSFLIMYGEALSLNTLATTLSKNLAQRTRPFVYNPEAPDELKFTKDSRKSFFSGHTSNVACMSFLTAKIFHDYFPDSKWRYAVWAFSATLPAVTGYMRVAAGKHFPTDVIIGYAFGAMVGYFIPEFHKTIKGPLKMQTYSDIVSNSNGILLVLEF